MNLEKVRAQAACSESHLRDIVRFCKLAPPGDFMECGVLRGGTAAVMINAAGFERKIWLCDTFGDFVKKGANDPDDNLPVSVGYTIEEVMAFMRSYEVPMDNVVFAMGRFGEILPDVMKKIGKLALVHFDGDWHDSVMSAFPHILRKLEPGGILIIHDYPAYTGLVNAVHKFIKPEDLTPLKDKNVYYVKGD